MSDRAVKRENLRKIFSLIKSSHTLDLRKIFQYRSRENTEFVFRGMITYYGRHYMAFFFSYFHQKWMQLNDERVLVRFASLFLF